MFRRIVVLLVLLLAGVGCSRVMPLGQTAEEQTLVMFEVPDARVGCCALVDLGDGGQLALGRADYRDGASHAWAARINPMGRTAWQRELLPERSGLSAGVATSTGDTYVVGYVVGQTGGAGTERLGQRLLLAKVQRGGGLDWVKTLSLGLDTMGLAAVLGPRGEIVVGGFVRDRGAGGSVFVAAFSLSGDLLWQTRIAEVAEMPEVHLLALRTGGYVASGSFGATHVDSAGAGRWGLQGLDVSAAVEDGTGRMRWLGVEGSPLSTQEISDDLCWIAGAWMSEAGRVVLAGNRCDRERELQVLEIVAGDTRLVAQIRLPAGATASAAALSSHKHLIALGMFSQDGPNALKGWFLKTPWAY